ncbi:unnamed protein product [Cylicocyclus nassatus]|uniref:Uncharacterized protein n=1 Tax=Cylicocyclus nassatus TaxID=53992 RepID=A0AA36ME95_CYLNA|nr:unnamed protein product [Cylicocyclus nassatus]
MAADRSSPWSRWDVPGAEYSPPSIQNDAGIVGTRFQYDTGTNVGTNVATNVLSNLITPQTQSLIRTGLVDQKVNTIDPSFYDCMYSTTVGQTIIERCYKDIGCCATTCCNNDDWKNKYGWAVALIVIFCILVVIAVVIWMIVWLINRSKDKKQKRLLEDSGLSRATSNMSLAQSTPNGYHFGTGPFQTPPGAGYRY